GDVPGEGEEAVAGGLLGAHRGVPVDPAAEDAGHGGDGLDVVHDGRAGVEPGDRRERRLEARLAAPALERVEQRRLLTADVGAGAGVDGDLEVVVAVRPDALADETGLAGLADGGEQ